MKRNTGRILPYRQAYYVHTMSRVVDRRFILGKREKEHFVSLMRDLEAFTGVEVVTYAVLDNHFHLLLYVPQREELSDEEIVRRLRHVYTRPELAEVKQRLERFKGYASPKAYEEERRRYLYRMYDLGEFMKALKQQFSCWYNRHHNRHGTLWEAKYKSVVVEGKGNPLLTMATYIDLNAVRAGLCKDPKDYRWCGYGEALGGVQAARAGLKRIARVMGRSEDWRLVHRTYRMWLYGAGEERGVSEEGLALRKGFDRKKVVEVWEKQGALSREELLRCRVRYFTDGVGIGGRGFLDELFLMRRERFGEKRKKGGSRMRGGGFGDLFVVRDLQVDVVT